MESAHRGRPVRDVPRRPNMGESSASAGRDAGTPTRRRSPNSGTSPLSSWSVIYILWHAVHLLERVFRSIASLDPRSCLMATNIVFAGTGAGTVGILLFDVSFVILSCVMLGSPYTGHLVFRSELTESVSTDAKVRTLHSSVVSGQGRIEPLRDRRRAMSECWDSGPHQPHTWVYPLA